MIRPCGLKQQKTPRCESAAKVKQRSSCTCPKSDPRNGPVDLCHSRHSLQPERSPRQIPNMSQPNSIRQHSTPSPAKSGKSSSSGSVLESTANDNGHGPSFRDLPRPVRATEERSIVKLVIVEPGQRARCRRTCQALPSALSPLRRHEQPGLEYEKILEPSCKSSRPSAQPPEASMRRDAIIEPQMHLGQDPGLLYKWSQSGPSDPVALRSLRLLKVFGEFSLLGVAPTALPALQVQWQM